MPNSSPRFLLPQHERALGQILLAVVRANPEGEPRPDGKPPSSDQVRVAQAVSVLLGRRPRRGPARIVRDDLLEMRAYRYSVENPDVGNETISATELAREILEGHDDYMDNARNASVAADLVAKFNENKPELLSAYAAGGSEDFDTFYRSIANALNALESAGIAVDWSILPFGVRADG